MADTPTPATGTRKEPFIPVGHPDFKWTSGADVQSTWRKYGWTPPSEKRGELYEEPVKQSAQRKARARS